MGAKNCPETPRQRLMAMLYLVLTAMLALNVSVDVLNAFVVVNESMEKTNEILKQKVDAGYIAFEQANAENPAKTGVWWDKAKKVRELANDLVGFIEETKWEVISQTERISFEEAKNLEVADINKKNNYAIPTNYFLGASHDGTGARASELKEKIIYFRTEALGLLDERSRNLLNIGLEVEGNEFRDLSGNKMNWEKANFYHTILVANVVLLNKLIADVRNAEADIVAQLLTNVDAGDFKFNKIEARVVPRSRFVIVGEEFEADIFVAAFDTVALPEVIVGSGIDLNTMQVLGTPRTLEGVGGIVQYRATASRVGEHTFGGKIRVPSPHGGTLEFPFSSEYMVGAPTATVSADRMNVLYIGPENPVSISVPGVPNEHVRPSITNGRLVTKGGGKFSVFVESGNETNINVSAEINGTLRSMGSFPFRVRRVPAPVAKIAGLSEGRVQKAVLQNSVLIPTLENFEFEGYNFVIVSYTFGTTLAGNEWFERTVQGNALTPEIRTIIGNARRGQRCFFEDITARAPNGELRKLNPITLSIQ